MVQVRTSDTARRDGARALWASLSPVRRDLCALKGLSAVSAGTGWQLLSSKASLECSLHSWAADKTLLTVSLSRDLTSSAVVSQVQMDPELCCFNYSLSYLTSLLVSLNSVLSFSNPLWQRLGALGAENLHQGNKEAASTSKPANSRLLTLTYDYNTPDIVKTQITCALKTEKIIFFFLYGLILKRKISAFSTIACALEISSVLKACLLEVNYLGRQALNYLCARMNICS